jgi:cell wall-associated NlpC family hydrolase
MLIKPHLLLITLCALALIGCASQPTGKASTQDRKPTPIKPAKAAPAAATASAPAASPKVDRTVEAPPIEPTPTPLPQAELSDPLEDEIAKALANARENPVDEPAWQRVVFTALTFHGRLYKYGGTGGTTVDSEEGFDCSGFVRRVFAEAARLSLPRSAADQAKAGTNIDANELQAGDLVFYNTLKRPFSHVGIYVGEGRFIHSPSKGKRVEIVEMKDRYWQTRFNGARRMLPQG